MTRKLRGNRLRGMASLSQDAWWPLGSLYATEFVRNRYYVGGADISDSAFASSYLTRASSAFSLGVSSLTLAASGALRRTDNGLFAGKARTQSNATPTDFTTWTKTNAVATGGVGPAPNGGTYTRISASATTGRVTKSNVLGLATEYLVNLVVKNVDSTSSRVQIQQVAAVAFVQWTWVGAELGSFNLANIQGVTKYGAYPIGGGAYSVWFAFTSDAVVAAHDIQFRPDTTGTGKMVDVAQVDIVQATMFTPTMANAADAADVVAAPIVLPSSYTVAVDFIVPPAPVSTGDTSILTLDTGNANIDDVLRVFYKSNGTVGVEGTAGGVSAFSAATVNPALRNTTMRITVLVQPSYYEVWAADNLVASGALGSPLPSFTRLLTGKDGRASSQFNGHVRAVYVLESNRVPYLTSLSPVMAFQRLHGQSNAAGRGAFSELTGTIYVGYQYLQPDGSIYFAPNAYTSGDFTTSALAAPLLVVTNASNNLMSDQPTLIGPEPALVRGRNPNTTLVKYAVGGTQLAESPVLDTWHPASTGELFDKSNACYVAAEAYLRAAGYKPLCQAIHWIQGEADANSQDTADAYFVNLPNLIAAYRTYHNNANLPFIIYRLNIANSSNFRDTVRAAQDFTALTVPYTALVDLDGIPMEPGGLHYTAAGYQQIGLRGRAAEATLIG